MPEDPVDLTPAASGKASEPTTPAAEPVPLEVPLEQQITDLPPLTYPGGETQEFQKWAEDRRRGRLRVELIGGVLMLIGGGVGFGMTGRVAFAVIAVFAIIALAAYEFLVNSFE